ncbi:uncharacterized protein LOC102802728 [Saccoglossus kowalevskii]
MDVQADMFHPGTQTTKSPQISPRREIRALPRESIPPETRTPRQTFLYTDIDKYTKTGNEELSNGHMNKATEAFEHAYNRAVELSEAFTVRACAFNLGAVYIATGQPQRGIELLEKAVPPENTKDSESNGDLFYNFGLAHYALQSYNEAIQNYEKAIQEYTEERNVLMVSETHCKLGTVYKYLKKFSQAEQEYQKAAEKYRDVNDVLKQITVLCDQAKCLMHTKDTISTIKILDDCLQLCGQQEQISKLGKIYHDLGLGYVQIKEFSKAVQCFELALPLVRGIHGDKKREAVILQNLGAVYNSLGDYQRALRFHETAASLHNELGDRNGQGQCFSNLAFAFSQLGDYESAGESYLHSLQAAKDAGDKKSQWQSYEGLAAVSFQQGNIEKAISQYKHALMILSQSHQMDTVDQERLVAKLSDALEYQIAGSYRVWGDRHVQPVRKHQLRMGDNTVTSNTATMTSPNRFVPTIIETQASIREYRPASRGKSKKRRKKRFGERHQASSDEENFQTIALGMEEYSTDSDMSVIRARTQSNSSVASSPTKRIERKPMNGVTKQVIVAKEDVKQPIVTSQAKKSTSKTKHLVDYQLGSSSSSSSLVSVTSATGSDENDLTMTAATTTDKRNLGATYEEPKKSDEIDETQRVTPPYSTVKKRNSKKHKQVMIYSPSTDDSSCDTDSGSESSIQKGKEQANETLYETLPMGTLGNTVPIREPPPPPSKEPPALPKRQPTMVKDGNFSTFPTSPLEEMPRGNREN